MIEARYQGKPINSIPEVAFAEGLSRSGLSPVLLLASPTTVPVTTDERWWLAKENVSGHYGRIFYAAVRELVIRSEILSAVGSISDENFTSEHMGYFERLTSDEKEVVFSDYLRTLAECSLTCTANNLVKLTQDLYPIDATPDNIRKLSTDRDALNELHIDGMVLFITGPAL
ncbi:TPA: hypothetical protein I8385_004062 [Citrobacter freundii]|uniref:hypothetical protein n=1 Tax=Enterobacteriaceae TaxID=543 RepID=UPI00107C7D68|nr:MULTISPECIES: hypothetical protein [Enterobacteriaceae]EAA7946834.1 hypothetical protein [Salmonella enterica]EHW0758894.1 hypothetical protein [Escherichia coli O157]EIA6554912.1 hypothetical protein [Escherichia coli]MDV1192203.1 hypothetical protein [Raoultella planticola]HAT2788681.1 hypothetical protein [Citrobacter freundii]